jgi:hypothetical protein
MSRFYSLFSIRRGALFAAAFGALAAVSAAREAFRLDRIAVTQFAETEPGKLRRTTGTLHLDGRTVWGATSELARPENLPAWALGRVLVRREDWLAYRALGFGATANFQLGGGAVAVPAGDAFYWVAEVNPEARFSDGQVINLSTRVRLAAAGDTAVAGFVIERRHRWVLIRGVGPALAAFGVTQALPDPILTLRKGSQPLYVNDNWNTRPDAGVVRAATAAAGAFALPEGGKDAALLVELAPGAYTVVIESATPGAGGEILVEVYSVPEPELN